MKKLLPLFSVLFLAVVFVACQHKTETTTAGKMLSYVDTAGLADFQKWKAQNELKDPVVYYQQGNEVVAAPPVAHTVKKSSSVSRKSSGGSMNSVSQYPAKTSVKKGWSRKAKGAVIGGGGGAVIGAIINKRNRVVGGAIGGAIGAGLGYVLGNELDRRHGR